MGDQMGQVQVEMRGRWTCEGINVMQHFESNDWRTTLSNYWYYNIIAAIKLPERAGRLWGFPSGVKVASAAFLPSCLASPTFAA
jgi:hypothetical protein